MPSRRQFVQAGLATASFGAALKLSAGCAPIAERLDSNNRSKSYNVLCCDGGGLKGLITAKILVRLEEKLGDRFPDHPQIRDHFSLMAGTSTGSIIACGLAQGIPAQAIATFYRDNATQIFPDISTLLRLFIANQVKQLPDQIAKTGQAALRTLEGILRRITKGDVSLPILETEALRLEAILQDVFELEKTLQDAERSVLAVAYDAYNRKPILLSNLEPLVGEADTRNVKIWEACRASAAVPGIFPSYLLIEPTLAQSLQNQRYGLMPNLGLPLIDGAVVTNNPSLWAIQKARQITQAQQPILVASFGTGQARTSFTPEDIRGWGLLDWFNPFKKVPMLEVMFSGNSDTVDSISRQMLDTQNNYLRFQPDLNQLGFGDQDISPYASQPESLDTMEAVAIAYLQDPAVEAQLEDLIQRLG